MRLCNYRLMNAIVFLIQMLVECKYCNFNINNLIALQFISTICKRIQGIIKKHQPQRKASRDINDGLDRLFVIHQFQLLSYCYVYVATNYTLYDISRVPGAWNGCSFEHDYAKTMPKLIFLSNTSGLIFQPRSNERLGLNHKLSWY